jgi:Gpi18-like mannosyltransferase
MKKAPSLLRYITVNFLLLTVFAVCVPRSSHPWDSFCWAEWSKYVLENGLGSVYYSFTDYLPLYHYILLVFGHMVGTAAEILPNIFYLKLFSLVFHAICGYFIFLIYVDKRRDTDSQLPDVFYYLLNIGVLYNALIWNQADIILSCLIFISFYFLLNSKLLSSLCFLVLALNFKLHAIVFIPLIGLTALAQLIREFSWKRIALYLLALAGLQFLILLPFIVNGSIVNLPQVITGSVDKYPYVSAFAYNMWHLLLNGNLFRTSDSIRFMNITYKTWGLLLFSVSSALAMLPLFRHFLSVVLKKTVYHVSQERLLLIFSLVPLLFFYFNTQMHERYSHPALPFIITYCILVKRPWIGILASSAYFLNLEDELHFLQLKSYGTLIFDPEFISLLWLLTIAGLFYELFNRERSQLKHPLQESV